jgi:transcriptional regulator with XRE-family HTH domain
MAITQFPVIDPVATGANITRLRQARGFTVRDLQQFFGFEEPQAIYKWQRGQSLPSIDNLYALSELFQISMNEILVSSSHIDFIEQQSATCCSNHMIPFFQAQWVWQNFQTA